MNKRNVAVAAIVFLAVAAGLVYYMYSPRGAVSRTLGTAHVDQLALHLNEESRTIFIVTVPIHNPTRVSVTIESAEVTLLVDGVDYSSRVLQNDPVVVNPGTTLDLTKLVQVTGSPVGYQGQGQGQVTYEIGITCNLVGSAESLGLHAEMNQVVEETINWTYDIL